MNHIARQHRPTIVVVCCVQAGLFSAATFGAEVDTLERFQPYGLVGVSYDTNVFRVDSPDQGGDLIEGSQLGDTIATIEAGFNSKLKHRRQEFKVHGRVFHNDYDRFDEVSFTGGDAKLTWNWALGDRWSGDLGYELRRGLRDFANQGLPRVDVTVANLLSATIARQLSARVKLSAMTDHTDVEFSQADRLNLRRAGVGFSLAYVSPKDNTVSMDGRYAERESQGPNNLGYTEWRLGPAMNWRLSDGMRLRATLQHAQRTEEDPELGDFSGLTGNLTGVWTTRRDHSVDFTMWRQLSTLGDEIANFAIVTGVKVEPTLRIGRRTSIGLGIGYENRDFRGEPEFITPPSGGLSAREDDVLTARLRLEWRIADDSRLSLEFVTEERDSSRLTRDYDFDRVQMNFRTGVSSLFGMGS